MIWEIDFDKHLFLDNSVRFDFAYNTKIGEKLVRETLDEHIKYDGAGFPIKTEIHPDYPFLIKGIANHTLLQGAVKVKYEWNDEDVFQKEHLDSFVEYENSLDSDFNNLFENFSTITDNSLEITYNYTCDTTKDFKTSLVQYIPYCTKASYEILENNSAILCYSEYEANKWTLLIADIPVGESFNVFKKGEINYLAFGQSCKVDDLTVPQFHVGKLRKDRTITNVSNKPCRIVSLHR